MPLRYPSSITLLQFPNRILRAIIFVTQIGLFCTQSAVATPQDARPSATIEFGNSETLKLCNKDARFAAVAIHPGETVNLYLALTSRFANTLIAVQALDGGAVSSDVTTAADGTASIAFQAGLQPGLYGILLSTSDKSAQLQFWVPDPENPGATPPLIVRPSEQ